MKQLESGVFLSVEGIDAAGKTTNIKYLADTLREFGYDVVTTREPGGCPLSEEIRKLVLGREVGPTAEVLLFAAARSEHIRQTIFPALQRKQVVISDRFHDSTYAYQGHGRGDRDGALEMERFVLRGFKPHYTLFFDLPLEVSMQRLQARKGQAEDRFDSAERSFKRRVWTGFQQRLRDNPDRMVRINADQSLEDVRWEVLKWVTDVFMPKHPLVGE